MPNAANVSFDVRGSRDSVAIAILELEDRKLFRETRLRHRRCPERGVAVSRVRPAAPRNPNAFHAIFAERSRPRAKRDTTDETIRRVILCRIRTQTGGQRQALTIPSPLARAR